MRPTIATFCTPRETLSAEIRNRVSTINETLSLCLLLAYTSFSAGKDGHVAVVLPRSKNHAKFTTFSMEATPKDKKRHSKHSPRSLFRSQRDSLGCSSDLVRVFKDSS